MKRKILFFSQGCPYPPYSGVDRRVLEMLAILKQLDCEVTFLSTNIFTSKPWERETVKWMEKNLVKRVCVYKGLIPREFKVLLIQFLKFVRLCCIKVAKYFIGCLFHLLKLPSLEERRASRQAAEPSKSQPEMFGMSFRKTPILTLWFYWNMKRISPDVIFMIYVRWHHLLNGSGKAVRITDANDLMSINSQLQGVLRNHFKLPVEDLDSISSMMINEDCFDRLDVKPDPREFENHDRFDITIAISPSEKELIQQHAKRTKVVYLPVSSEVFEHENTYDGGALLPTGPNLFNLQGLCYFIRRVLPIIRCHLPEFRLTVTGKYCCEAMPPSPQVDLLGHRTDEQLNALYAASKFVVNPVLGGTGQMVKVVEAMAHGLPVILLESAKSRAPILQHGVNGFFVKDAQEFATHAIRLWTDRDLCARMGKAARESVRQNLSREHMMKELRPLVFDPVE
jgi:glycosyltransferase involved in cell wall biosynthesis